MQGLVAAICCFVLLAVGASAQHLVGATLHGPYRSDLQFLHKLHANAVRVRLPWRLVQRDDIKNANEIDRMTVMRSRNYYGSQRWWKEESRTHNYPQADEVVYSVVDTGFTVVGVIGEGTLWSLPTANGVTVCPNDLGTQTYLSLVYRYARMVVMRYKHVIQIWQIESALNAAHLHSLWGWRCDARGGLNLWADEEFRTQVLDALHKAVKDEDPSARVTTMLDTDISAEAYQALGIKGHHAYAAKEWKRYLDIVGISSYPNVFEPAPIKGDAVGEVIAELKTALPGKPVYVLETGYPVQYTEPSQSGAYYTEELQSEFVKKTFAAAMAAGASGFFYTGIWSDTSLPHHIVGTAWGRWSQDRAAAFSFRVLGPSLERDDVSIVQQFQEAHGVHSVFSEDPIEGFEHFGNHYAPKGSAWGLVDPEKNAQRPAFAALATAFHGVKGIEKHLQAIGNEITKRYGAGP